MTLPVAPVPLYVLLKLVAYGDRRERKDLASLLHCRRPGIEWETGHGLRMTGYYDRVLRDGESTLDTVRYVLRNPIAAGLANKIGDSEFAGSDVFSRQELDELLGE